MYFTEFVSKETKQNKIALLDVLTNHSPEQEATIFSKYKHDKSQVRKHKEFGNLSHLPR